MVLCASCGRENLEDAYSLIGEDEPDADLVGLILRLGNTHYFAGNPERASELNERGLGFAEALQLPEQLSRGWSTKATLVAPLRPEEARGLFELALDTALAHELYSQAAMVCGNLSDLHLRHDRYGESLDNLEQALKVAHRIGSRPSEWFALSEMTYALAMLGRWEEALARFAEIPDEQIGKEASPLSPVSGILEIHLERGQLDEARRLLGRYEELARSGDAQAQSCYLPALAAVRLAEGDHRAALAAAEQAFATRKYLGTTIQSAKLGFLHGLEAARALDDHAKMNELLQIVEALPPGSARPFTVQLRSASARTLVGTIRVPTATSPPRKRSSGLSGFPSISRSYSSSTASGSRLAGGPMMPSRCSGTRGRRSNGSMPGRGSSASTPPRRVPKPKSSPDRCKSTS